MAQAYMPSFMQSRTSCTSVQAPSKENILWSGWLQKRGPTISYAWRKRYIIMIGDLLYYYSDEEQQDMKGTIPLKPQSAAIVFSDSNAIGDAIKHVRERPYGFVFDSDPSQGKKRRLYYFDAEVDERLKSFMDAFKIATSSVRPSVKRASKLLLGGLYGSVAGVAPIKEEQATETVDQPTEKVEETAAKASEEINKPKELKEQEEAAKKIQSIQRGKKAREEVKAKKEDKDQAQEKVEEKPAEVSGEAKKRLSRAQLKDSFVRASRDGSLETGLAQMKQKREAKADASKAPAAQGASEPPKSEKVELSKKVEVSKTRLKGRESKEQPPPPEPKLRLLRGTPISGADGSADLSGELGKQRKLADGVDMYTLKDPDSFKFTYSVANFKLAVLQFTLDASGSNNMKSEEWGSELKVTKEVQPHTVETLGTLERDDPGAGANLGLGFSWTFKPVDKAAVLAAEGEAIEARKTLAEQMRSNGILASELGSAEAIVAKLQEAGLESFIDAEFFPDENALFNDPSSPESAPVVFRRAKEFVEDGKPCVFDKDVTPADIKQGALGDCWFLSSISALAEFPELVRTLFVTSECNDFGVFEVRCFKNGTETRVIVDDYFPCQPGSGKPCYSRSTGDELWVMLLEKVWAKLHGSYEQIESGAPVQAIMDLTGAFGHSHNFGEPEIGPDIESGAFYDKLRDFDEKNYLMCAGTAGNDELTKADRDQLSGGIVPGHAYTLKAVKEAQGNKLLQLRNPWGRFEWDGDWCDKSDLWTDEMKEALQPRLDAEDGQFWMGASDFFANYNDINVVYARGHTGAYWKSSRKSFTTSAQEDVCSQVFEVDIPAGATGYLGVCQQDERMKGAPSYSRFSFALFGPCDENGIPAKEVCRSNSWRCRQSTQELPQGVDPGKYIAVIYNTDKAEVPVTFVTLLDADGLDAVSVEQREFTPELQQGMILSTLLNSPKADRDDYGIMELARSFLPNRGYAVAVRNKHSANLSITFDFSGCTGLAIEGSDAMDVEIEVEPSEEFKMVAVFKPVQDRIGFGMGLSYREC